ncbi:MAG: flavin prenyltransferase UbiX [Steroidobacteraceae bacterium]
MSPVAVALTGASGMQYALRLLELLVRADVRLYVMVSKAARAVFSHELDIVMPAQSGKAERFLSETFGAAPGQLQVFGPQEWTAPTASGSGAPQAMVVCPCTMGTLSAIAQGSSDDLITRSADVVLKERRLLILVPRETPFSPIHLRNMLRLAELGALMLAANPGYYHRPRSVQEVVDFIVARILDHLRVPHSLVPPWGAQSDGRPPDADE